MIQRALPNLALAALAATGLSACAGMFTKDSQGPGAVDDFLVRIERVHVQSELSREGVRDALDLLHELADPQFQGDPVTAFERFEEALDEAKKRRKSFRKSGQSLEREAKPFFDQWAANLVSFTNTELRLRSQERLLATRERYDAIETALRPVEGTYEETLALFKDVSLFLEHDFNAASVSAIQTEIDFLTSKATELDGQLQECLSACRHYVENAALPIGAEERAARADG